MKSLSIFAALAGTACGFTPDVNHVQPRGGQRGTEMEIRFHGERLQYPREILFHEDGIEVLELSGQEDGKLAVAKIRLAPEAQLGEHAFRLRTSGGVSVLRTLWIGQFPAVAEAEPNNDFDSPQPIDLNVTVEGIVTSEDEDFFRVNLKKGQPLAVEVEAMRLGRRFFDAYVAILDPHRFELASCDDATLLRNDAYVSIVAPEDGEYRVVVREAAYEGSDDSQYRLHIGTFPRPAAVFPTGAKPGETATFQFTGDPSGTITREIAIPADAEGVFPVFAEREGLTAPSPNWIYVSKLTCANEAEPNDRQKSATPTPEIPFAIHGVLSGEEDRDWFRITGKKGQNLEIRIRGRELRSPIDSVISFHDSSGKSLANNDDQGSPDSFLQATCPEDGDYLVHVRDKLKRSGDDFTYRLEVDLREPVLSARLPEFGRNESQSRKVIAIPRGNRYATVVNIGRRNLACDILFEAADLPPGITMHLPPIPRSLNEFPVVFEAAPEASIEGAWQPFTIRATGENVPPVSGPLREVIHHIEINKQGPYHSTSSEKIAVAVTGESPISLTVDSPRIPVVKNGTLRLAAHLQRRDDFKGPVTLRMIWKPPGIGAPDTIRIEEGQSDAEYEINANGDAPPGDWQVCLLAEADTPQGPVLVSSALIPLQVAEPWISASIDLGATEQGRDVPLVCKLEHLREFSGNARAELIGLPHGTSTEPVEFTRESSELTFPIKVAGDAAIGKHSGLFLRIDVPDNGATVLHQTGQGGTLRIDAPAPAIAKEDNPPPPPDQPAEKPLSRLEQLRAQAK